MIIISRWSGNPQRFQGMDYCVPEVESASGDSLGEKILRIVLRIFPGKALKEAEKRALKKKEQLGPESRVVIALNIKEIK